MATYRKLSSGNIQAIVRVTGYRPRSRTFRTKALAHRWAIKTEDALKTDSGTLEDVPTMQDAIDMYMEEISPLMAQSSESTRKYMAKLFKNMFGNLLVNQVTPELLKDTYLKKRIQQVSSDTIRREMSFLSQIFQQRDHWSNPTYSFRKQLFQHRALDPAVRRDRRLSDNEEHLLSSFCSYDSRTIYMYWVIQLILTTALDRSEITCLPRTLLGKKKYKLPRSKNSSKQAQNRTILLKKNQQIYLKELSLLSTDKTLLVPIRPDSLTQQFSRTCKRLEIKDLTLKDLRGECAHRWAEKGVEAPFIAAMMGDSIETVFKHYVNNIDVELIRNKL